LTGACFVDVVVVVGHRVGGWVKVAVGEKRNVSYDILGKAIETKKQLHAKSHF